LVGLWKAEDEFGKVQQLADKVTTLAEHGEIVDAASSAVAIQERLTAVHEAKNSLLRIKEGAHSIMVKVYLDDMLATQKKLLEELQARAREREEQAEEDAQPILDNTVVWTVYSSLVMSFHLFFLLIQSPLDSNEPNRDCGQFKGRS
jgi:hypothetical protein